ncbi:MAG: MvaI/BcnI family restriction endonuclease [Myxococcota bacterium]
MVPKKSRTVTYESACLYWEPSITSFIDAVQQGIVAIDFDARTTDKNGLRDHGTKFRVAVKNLGKLYRKSRKLG